MREKSGTRRAAAAEDRGPPPDPWQDPVEGTIVAGTRELRFVHPREVMDLVDEEAFERTEYLPYWAQLWPSGITLARAASARPLDGVRVLEVGCGIGLPSVAAALSGARVLATDWSSDAVEFTAANARRNGVTVETAACSWTEPGPMVSRAPWDIVLAADVLYERRNVSQLLELLPRLVDGFGEVWLADPERRTAMEFLTAAEAGWHRVTTVDTGFPTVHIHRLRRNEEAENDADGAQRLGPDGVSGVPGSAAASGRGNNEA